MGSVTGWLFAIVVLSRADLAVAEQTDAGWDLMVTTTRPTNRTCYDTPGLPDWLNGRYLISGPAMFEVGNYSADSLFDGLGMANRFEIGNGRVCYTSAWIQSTVYNTSMKTGLPAPGMYFEHWTPELPSCPLTHPLCHLSAPNDNIWVNSIQVGEEILLITDTDGMLRFDLDTLTTLGTKAWADDKKDPHSGQVQPSWAHANHQASLGSAHPLLRPGHPGIYVEVLVEMGELPWSQSYVSVYTFNASIDGKQNRTKLASVPGGTQYFHSFGVTTNYAILTFDISFELPGALIHGVMLDAFKGSWKQIHLVDFEGRVQTFDTDAFVHVHMANCFENATGVVCDLGATQDCPFAAGNPQLDIKKFTTKAVRDALSPGGKSHMRRIVFHLAGPLRGKTTWEQLDQEAGSVDFPKINPAFSGLPYCVYYVTEWFHDHRAMASMAVRKHDTCKGEVTVWNRENAYPGEAFFIGAGGSDPSREDEGVLVFPLLNGTLGKSSFMMLDAKTMKELSEVQLDAHIPFTAHGNFYPQGKAADAVLMI